MVWQPVPIIGGAYADDARPWSHQDTVNWLPVLAERPGGRTPAKLVSAPGMTLFCVAGNGPIRGMHDAEGKFFVVSGDTLYQIATTGAATSLGTIPGSGLVSMAHNQVTGGNQVAIATGDAGYIYDTTLGTLSQITDEGFPGSRVFDFLGQYFVGIEPQRRFWMHSALADGLSYNTIDRYEAEASPDRLVGLLALNNEVLVAGERTTEFYANVGGATAAFDRMPGTTNNKGCAAAHTLKRLDNSAFMLGSDGIVYRLDGYRWVRVSTGPMEQAISRCDLHRALAFTFEDRGHAIYYLTLPDGQTWGYDVSQREWHRRESHDLDRWRLNALIRWNGRWYGGDYATGKIWLLDWAVASEGDDPLERRRITGVLHDNQNPVSLSAVELVLDWLGENGDSGLAALSVSGDLPDGVVGSTGTLQYVGAGGVHPLTYSISSGSLPAGATMDSVGLVTYDYTTEATYAWTVQVTDSAGNTATVDDTAQVSALACGVASSYDGGESFPTEFDVLLGASTGIVELRLVTGDIPDKVEVWLGGVKVLDTGYIGDTSYQSALDTALAARSLPSETITQHVSTLVGTIAEIWDAGQWDERSFTKSTTDAVATVKVYAPLDTTVWKLALSCPGGFP